MGSTTAASASTNSRSEPRTNGRRPHGTGAGGEASAVVGQPHPLRRGRLLRRLGVGRHAGRRRPDRAHRIPPSRSRRACPCSTEGARQRGPGRAREAPQGLALEGNGLVPGDPPPEFASVVLPLPRHTRRGTPPREPIAPWHPPRSPAAPGLAEGCAGAASPGRCPRHRPGRPARRSRGPAARPPARPAGGTGSACSPRARARRRRQGCLARSREPGSELHQRRPGDGVHLGHAEAAGREARQLLVDVALRPLTTGWRCNAASATAARRSARSGAGPGRPITSSRRRR